MLNLKNAYALKLNAFFFNFRKIYLKIKIYKGFFCKLITNKLIKN